jgi:hypothetical protein
MHVKKKKRGLAKAKQATKGADVEAAINGQGNDPERTGIR